MPVRRTPTLSRILALAALLVLPGCATFSYQEEQVVLEDTTWRIIELEGMTVRTRSGNLDLRPHLYIDSADGRVHGAGGCNRFSGNYRATGTEISFGPLVTTRSTCADADRQRMETEILRVLEAITSYRLDDDRLWFYVGGEAVMEAVVW